MSRHYEPLVWNRRFGLEALQHQKHSLQTSLKETVRQVQQIHKQLLAKSQLARLLRTKI